MEGSAARCADQLVRENVLFSKSLGGGKFQYAAYNHENEIDVTPFEEQIDRKSTSAFITEELADRTRIVDAISLGGSLKRRYELRYVSSSDFDSTIKQLRNTEEKYEMCIRDRCGILPNKCLLPSFLTFIFVILKSKPFA